MEKAIIIPETIMISADSIIKDAETIEIEDIKKMNYAKRIELIKKKMERIQEYRETPEEIEKTHHSKGRLIFIARQNNREEYKEKKKEIVKRFPLLKRKGILEDSKSTNEEIIQANEAAEEFAESHSFSDNYENKAQPVFKDIG